MDRTMYGKVLPGTYYPYRCTLKNGCESPGYALLADLQNTISPHGSNVGSPVGGSSNSGGYGSLNGSRGTQRPYSASPSRGAEYGRAADRYASQSPTYQNQQQIVQETITTKTSHHGANMAPSYSPNSTLNYSNHRSTTPNNKPPTLNNNLSELDTLLQDLSNAHYNSGGSYVDRRNVNGTTSPGYGSTHHQTKILNESFKRPSVDSLLEELNTAVPTNGDVSGATHTLPRQVTITVKETKTETTGGYPTTPRSLETQHHVASSNYVTSTPAASSATKELDDLMASLSDFKINAGSHQLQTVTDSPYAKPNKATKSAGSPLPQQNQTQYYTSTTTTSHVVKQNQLDSMLGNLQADMSRQGINTTQKGCCSACDKPIVGQVITALGKTWHPEHFTCTHCTQELGTRNFFERDGHPYCEPDYHNLFSPRCAYCNGPILDKCVTALEKTWHTEHFFCAQCGKQFGEEGFHERDGKPYCREDYFDMFAPKCGGCSRAIMENYISALNSQWHPDCFVCRDCRQPFHGGSFFDHEGLPYCETHYHAKRGSLCAGCHKPITGRCITAMFRKFHPEHFVCAFCLKQLNKGTFKEQNDKPYCHTCFEKLFG
ncbi:leupaxin-like isoform X3 [Chrysoperla carnea]|uniref:leupaxin-like isoform X3 n=1 Tax=Chrysoperla carnea TaxID=189513 RepID=UPI001D0978D1|nr:leupaxin-like isoform X3 [Chrysoperla carnea]